MAELQIFVAGVPEIRNGGVLLKFPTRKALALLVYLAVEGGTQPRDKLIALFWPDSDDEMGRASLRNTLAYLNKTLRAVDETPHLIASRDNIGLDFDSGVWMDTQALFAEPPAMYAVEHYRGDFLDGFTLNDAPDFDTWASVQRERLHRRITEVCRQLVREAYGSGQTVTVVAAARRWVAIDPFDETAHQWLIRGLLASGDRKGAQSAYETLRIMLDNEFGALPSPETQTLLTVIQAALPAVQSKPAVSTARILLPEIPFTGRAAELHDLITAFHATRQGTQAVAITGEAGMGKTRLVHEFLNWARAEGSTAVEGRAFDSRGRLPYQVIVEVLHAVFTPEAFLSLASQPSLSPWLAELQRLLPELREDADELPPDSDLALRSRLFEAVTRSLDFRVGAQPFVLFIDDVQWADPASLDLLQYATRSWSERKVNILVLLSARQEDLTSGSPISDWFLSLSREIPLKRLTLAPLDAGETLYLVQALGTDKADQLGQWLFASAQGHPFYTAETLKDLLERGEISANRDANGTWSLHFKDIDRAPHYIPSVVREIIQARLARLSLNATLLLIAGAVLGQDFNFDLLCQVAALDESTGLDALDELLTGRLLVEIGTQAAYNFVHDKIRVAAYESASMARRRIFHRRTLDALLTAASVSPAMLAYHASAAGLVDQAAQYSDAAGDAAMQLFALRDAIYHYEQARTLSNALEYDAPLIFKLARAYELNAQEDRAHQLYEELLTSADIMPSNQAVALYRLSMLAAQTFDVSRAVELLQRALVVTHNAGDTQLRAEMEWNLAQLNFYQAEFDAAYVYAEGALRWARDLGQSELVARSLNVLAYIQSARGNQQAAVTYADEAHMLYVELGNVGMNLDSLGIKANALLRYGDTQAALDITQPMLKTSREIGGKWGEVNALLLLTLIALDEKRWQDATDAAQQAVQIVRGPQSGFLPQFARLTLGVAYRRTSRIGEAIAMFEEVLSGGLSEAAQLRVKAELCAAYVLDGDWQQAGRYARDLLTGKLHPLLLIERDLSLEVAALLHSDNLDGAAELIRRYSESVGDSPRHHRILESAKALLAQSAP